MLKIANLIAILFFLGCSTAGSNAPNISDTSDAPATSKAEHKKTWCTLCYPGAVVLDHNGEIIGLSVELFALSRGQISSDDLKPCAMHEKKQHD